MLGGRFPIKLSPDPMLVARGSRTFTGAKLDWALGFTEKLWVLVVDRDGLTLDTRFVPGAPGAARATQCIYLLSSGAFEAHGPEGFSVDARTCMVLSDEELEGGDGKRSFTFRAAGAPFTSVQLYIPEAHVRVRPDRRPPVVVVGEDVWAAAEILVQHARGVGDDATLARGMEELLRALGAENVVDADLAEHAHHRTHPALRAIWLAIRPMIERFDLLPTSKQISEQASVSPRSVDRYLVKFVESFGQLGHGWRAGTRHLRVKMAALLLSAESVSIAEVATAVGYGSTDAMARAFRDAGMPPPSAVQESLRRAGFDRR